MIIKEKYTKSAKLDKLSGTIVFFTDKNFSIRNTDKILSSLQKNLFKKNLKKNNKKKKIFSFDINPDQKIVIYSEKDNRTSYENIGAELYEFLKSENLANVNIFVDTVESQNKIKSRNEIKILRF